MRVSFSGSVAHAGVGVGGGRGCRRGFTLVEAAMTLVVLGVLVAILVVAGDRTRRTAMLSQDLSNMRQIATLTGQYAADNQDLFWTFSWQGGEIYNSKYPDLNNPQDDKEGAVHQAVVILRDHAGRPDFPKITGWYPHLMYSHLPLLQHAGLAFPNRLFISAGEKARLLWASDPLGFDQGKFLPNQPQPSLINKRWPYSSSYQMASSFFDQAIATIDRVSQAGSEQSWNIPSNGDLRARTLSDTAFPSQKVHLHDKYAWHFGTTEADSVAPAMPMVKGYPFFAEPHARLPLLFVDGHAAVHRSADSNPGGTPTSPTGCGPTTFQSPSSNKVVYGRYRWTRHLLGGRDIAGPDPPPKCPV